MIPFTVLYRNAVMQGFKASEVAENMNNLHPWFFHFENDPETQSQVNGSYTKNIESAKKPSTTHMPTFSLDSTISLDFSAWLTAICGGGTSNHSHIKQFPDQ